MARKARGLTAKLVDTIKSPGDYADGHGLYLRVTSSGNKTWWFRYQVKGKRHAMGLGPVRLKSLSQARAKALELAIKITEGIDPIQERRANSNQGSISFIEATNRYIQVMQPSWKNEKHSKQWRSTIEKYCSHILTVPVDNIDTKMVLKCLEPIWHLIPETASRLRGRIEKILDWSRVNGFRNDENPARWRGHLEQSLPRRAKVRAVKGHAAMPFDDLPGFWKKLNYQDGQGARALEFAILTACRTGEVLNATWGEIKFETKSWIIPAARMKAGKEHRIPLSEPAIAQLDRLEPKGLADLIFPGQNRRKPLSNMAMLKTMHRLGVHYTPHGFRSTFRTWISEETNHSHEVAEAALAHVIGNKVVAAYNRGDLFEKRRTLMVEWSQFVTRLEEDIEASP